MGKTYRIVEYLANDFKGLRSVYFKPTKGVTIISGQNAVGKSAVLDSLKLTLRGGHAKGDVDTVIRRGAKDAQVQLEIEGRDDTDPNTIEELTVRRRWWTKKGGGTGAELKVLDGEDNELKSPQAILDSLTSAEAVDPLEFTRLSVKEQVDILIRMSGEGDTLVAMDGERKLLEERRRVVGSKARDAQGALAAMPPVAGGTPDSEIDGAAIVARIADANAQARAVEDARRDVATMEREGRTSADKVKALEAELAAEQAKLTGLRAGYADAKQRMDALPTPPDTAALQSELAEVDNVNRQVRAKLARKAASELCTKLDGDYDRMTGELAALDKRKTEIIAGVKLPVDGMTFDDTGVRFNGTPLNDCSGSEQLIVGLGVSVANAPKLGLLIIKDGPLLDAKRMALVDTFAEERGVQIVIERIDQTGNGVIVLVDGEIQSDGTIAENK